MDGETFDRMVATLSGHRRTMLGALAAGVTALVLGHGAEEAEAAPPVCKPLGDPCQKKGQCCSGTCKKKRGKPKGRCRCAADRITCEAGSEGECCPTDAVCCDTGTGGEGGCCAVGTPQCCPIGSGNAGCCNAGETCCAATDMVPCCPGGQTCCPAGSSPNCNDGSGCG